MVSLFLIERTEVCKAEVADLPIHELPNSGKDIRRIRFVLVKTMKENKADG